MRSVNIGELKNQLSGYLQHVRNGEEIVIRDRSVAWQKFCPSGMILVGSRRATSWLPER